ncbi:MRP8 [Candida pseudojiufengensis]|uniref:MRP8 n=1 Tax=Candida pseudojiufengensis TaxID=497109 RepID=UPI002224AC8E|nr:MRP8 [Candida pseudojiufengensis]KAI5965846.1 MRP8 [Candida pseudojiufengensis]
MSDNSENAPNITDLPKKIQDLESIFEIQSKLIATTKQKLIELQLNEVKSKMKQLDTNNNIESTNTSDFVNNEDIVQLVTELQSQLDSFEDRTLRRTYNSSLNSNTDKIAPLSNKDGDFPDFQIPITIDEFKNLSKEKVIEMGFFYEIILPTKEEIDQVLNSDENKEQNNSKIDIININKNKNISQILSEFSDEQVDEIFDDLARFFGIKLRRVSDGW